jgi:hypothetical protein
MITKIAIENFKGIGDRVELELKPLTLLFGPNSAGKSSILHALHYAREVFQRRNLDADRTVAGGDLVKLGGFRNFVHGHDLNREVKLSIEIAMWGGFEHPTYWHAEEDSCDQTAVVLSELVSAESEILVAWSDLHGRPYLRSHTTKLNNEWITSVEYPPDGSECRVKVNTAHCCLFPADPRLYLAGERQEETAWLVPVEDFESLAPDFSTVRSLDETASALLLALAVAKDLGVLAITLEGDTASIALQTRGPGEPWPDGFVFSFEHMLPNECRVGEWRVAEQKIEFGPGDNALRDGPPADMPDSVQRVVHFCEKLAATLREIAVPPYDFAEGDLQCVTSLGPLRTTPDRHYVPSEHRDESLWASGLGAWVALYEHGESFLDCVNSWLADPERLDTGYRLKKKYIESADALASLPQDPDMVQPPVAAQLPAPTPSPELPKSNTVARIA